MDPLSKQLRELPGKLLALPRAVLLAAAVAIAGAVGGTAFFYSANADHWQYAFSSLAPEDSTEVAAALKGAGIPFRLEAGGSALAVPAEKVYDVRLLLAAVGLPRGGGAGFELFDRGDLGISEFTQKVNLRRALEGELARTVGHLAHVRSARVHLTLGERGLYRDEEHKAAAAVVLAMQAGYSLGEREISGIRHLVASSVPGLAAESVTIVDGRGSALSTESLWGEAEAFRQREFEKSIEARLVTLLEPVVGVGAVVARVAATLDNSEVTTSREAIDPQTTLKTEHKVTQSASSSQPQNSGGGGGGGFSGVGRGVGGGAGGVAGAAANQPIVTNGSNAGSNAGPGAGPGAGPAVSGSTTTALDETRNFDVGRTVTKTTAKGFRLNKLSVALLVDGQNGAPRADEDLQQLAELARKAVGFDPARGDQLEISSAVFTRSAEPEALAIASEKAKGSFALPGYLGPAALGAVTLLLLVWMLRGARSGPSARQPRLRTGESVAALEAELAGTPLPSSLGGRPVPGYESTPDPNVSMRDRARELVGKDPNRAALLLKAWISADEVSNA